MMNEGRRGPGRRAHGNRPGPRPDGPPRGRRPSHSPRNNSGEFLQQLLDEGWYFGLITFEGTPVRASLNFPDTVEIPAELGQKKGALIQDAHGYRHIYHRDPSRTISVIAYPKEKLTAYMQKRQWIIIGISSFLFTLSIILGWFLIGRALRPLKAIQETAQNIAGGKLSTRIDETSQKKNEIRTLSENLNQSFSQLESMFDRQKRFTADASHELRTPISVILGYCEMALSENRTPEQIREAVLACQRAGDRMKSLTNDLLELSKIESGEINFEFTDCPIDQIAEEAIELVEPLAAQKGVILKEDIEQATITANGDRLWQVLVNLLNNAIRHTPAGKSITLKTKTKGDRVEISVIDEGEGIPANALPHLFDRFYRVDSSRNRDKGGSGLGLAICETIIKAHRGTLTAESVPGMQTRFVASLPA